MSNRTKVPTIDESSPAQIQSIHLIAKLHVHNHKHNRNPKHVFFRGTRTPAGFDKLPP